MEIRIKPFGELTPAELYDLLKLRQEVFIIEQQCIYPDMDGDDVPATHVLLYDEELLAAYSRILPPGIKFDNDSAIGRIIVHKNYRGTGVGKQLIAESISLCRHLYPEADIRIEAQSKLSDYYRTYGFLPVSSTYTVDGIEHLQMILSSLKNTQ